ncbi:MAG: aminopeptidase N, partial [Pseudooceanicola sp.]|nr:aminopeptidase N [Pseudooceanicola sp.]
MKDAAPETIHLKDYKPFGFELQSVELTFDLAPETTRVKSRIAFRPEAGVPDRRFFLHGENLTLIAAEIDGTPISPDVTPEGLTCAVPDTPFVWTCEVEIAPAKNTALEGLYMSNGMYC